MANVEEEHAQLKFEKKRNKITYKTLYIANF